MTQTLDVDIAVLLTFNKLKKLTTDVHAVAEALHDSELLQVITNNFKNIHHAFIH